MSHLIRRVSLLAALIALSLGVPMGFSTRAADEKPDDSKKTLSVEVHHNTTTAHNVLVELYLDGKAIRSAELRNTGSLFDDDKEKLVVWQKLAPGRYELHCTAKGFKTVVKRFILAEDDKPPKLRVELSKEDAIVGSSVSLEELEKRIKELEKVNAELRAEIEKLKKK